MVFDLLKCFAMFFLVICAMVVGPILLQLHVSALEIKQAEQMIEAIQNTPAQFRSGSPYDSWRQAEQINDTRISEYRPD
tara:strand:- start:25 stop:261 length:237 start_codon:yes stop_codon:yes gene_type:complete